MKNYAPISPMTMTLSTLKDTNPLVLSFVGDGVHTLFVRTQLTFNKPYHNSELHSLAINEVRAEAQAQYLAKILPFLNEDENFIYRKAKSAKTNNLPKHATLLQYHLSTAFEAIVGYLYLSGQNERLQQLFDIIYNDDNGQP